MHDSHSDDDKFWSIGESSPKASQIVVPSPVKKGDIELNEDKSDLHDILDALLNFESTIEPSNDVTLTNPYTHSLTQAPVDNYGNASRRQEVERENSRLAKQIKQSKPCVVRSSHGQVSIIKSTVVPASINRTRLTRIEQENLNLLKRIQSAETSKEISRREHERHYESHKVYGKISSKQTSLDSSPGIKSMSNLSKPEWIT
ncbi:Cilia- and flagella-associated protein 97-like [Oopsacas minuta]|uniref:Cilia- and flagella-associated protein 97-like n=1 Tax=Oopsacas minuta TaxID=111878 RepID=A0AAV7JG77_9METZ|nr:Cilia- and flagella-associated protein 97-like [Oopsacas minuta]